MSDKLDNELLKIDAYISYWQEYKSLLKEPSQESYFTDSYIETGISVPESVLNFSKANVHNARILIAAAISKVFDLFEITEQVSVALGQQAIPLIKTEKLSLADSAKAVLSHFKSHLNHLPAPEFYPAFVCIAQNEIQKKVLINLSLNESVSEIRAYIPTSFQSFTGLLLQESFKMIEQIRNVNDYEPSVEIKNSFDALNRSQLPEIVYSIWAEIHPLPLHPDKSYLENGADSIQAIRFLSRLQKEGYKVELTSLLEARKMAEWQPEFIGIPISEPDNQDNYEAYPLSLNQQIIWNDWAGYHQHQIYHEQFLFKLSTCPDVSLLQDAFQHIWLKYPQLSISIHAADDGYRQKVQNRDCDFRILTADDISLALEEDLMEGFSKNLMRCTFISCKGEKYLLWSHHHVILDGWSVGKLIAEFILLIENGIPQLQKAVNHQHLLVLRESKLLKKDTQTYWKHFFNGRTAVSLTKQRSDNEGFDIITDSLNISALKSSIDQAGVSLQTYLLCHFFLTIYSMDSKCRTYIHSISSGRTVLPEYAEEAIGLFIRNIVPGFDISDEDTMYSLLKNVQQNFLRTIEMEFSAPEIINSFQDQRPDVLFVFENYPYEKIQGNKISGELIYNHELTGYPLTFLIMPADNDIQLKFIYDSSLFNGEFIKQLSDKFKSLVLFFNNNLHSPIHQLESQLEKIEVKTVKYPIWYDEIITKSQLSKNFVSSTAGPEKINYQYIENYALRFLKHFEQLPRSGRIAVFGYKNELLPVIAYAIMRNGFVYVPIHNAWPIERINQTLKIADCRHLIVLNEADKALQFDGIQVHHNVFQEDNVEDLTCCHPHFEEEAYVLFTSGSTGSPKGVSLTHRNLSSFLDACLRHTKPEDFDIIFSFTNIAFDLSIYENLFGLYSDKPIHVIQKPEQLWSELQKHRRILLNTVPSVLNRLGESEIPNISVIHTAGEPFTESGWQQLKKYNQDIRIINWYGPTETSTYSTCINLSEQFDNSVGYALEHEVVLVADALGLPQIDCLPGEIIIGGDGVANYLFPDNGKFISTSKTNFYRTGDRGYLKDNKLYLLGRTDRQVKRLGQRFELSEIEQSLISDFSNIKRVYYHKTEDSNFILFIESGENSTAEIKKYLELKFPPYMLPDSILCLNAFPENSNGKMDISTMLSELESDDSQDPFDNELLSALKKRDAIFRPLKGNLSFIAQGGDSIIGLRMISKMKQLGYRVEISDLLNADSINEWVESLKTASNQELVLSGDVPFLTPIQKWFREEYPGNKNHFNQSILLELFLPLSASETFELLKNCFAEITFLQNVFKEKWVKAKEALCRYIEIQDEAEIEAHCSRLQESFDLTEGPVAAIALFVSAQRKFLFLSLHHFYCDGISWRNLMDHLQSSINGKPNSQPDSKVFAKVFQKNIEFGSMDEGSDYYPENIQNPFKNETICTYAASQFISFEWNESQSHYFLREWNRELSLNEKFVSYFLMSWLRSNKSGISIFLETHGRQYEQIPEIADALGWFTQFYPLSDRHYPEKEEAIISYVRESFRRLPNFGLGYMGMSNWQRPPFPVLLNFLGSFDENWGGMAKPMNLNTGEQVDPKNPLLAFVEINGIILEGKIKWMFRAQPSFRLDLFAAQWNNLINAEMGTVTIPGFYVDDLIDDGDLNQITDMLNLLD